MPTVLTPLARGAAGAVLAVVLTACGSDKPSDPVTVTVPAGSAQPSSAATAGGSTSPSAPSGSAASTRTGPQTKLAGTCESQLPDFLVSQELSGAQLVGTTAFVVGQPDKAIGRVGYLNCRYGVTGAGATAKTKVEIGVSLYTTEQQATSRIGATVEDYKTHGAASAQVMIDGSTGTRLTGGSGVGYDVPVLVVAEGQRTVAVSVDPAAANGVAEADVKLTALALKRTAG